MPLSKTRPYSRYTRAAAALLGSLIKLGRKERRWTEQELADRAGISRATLKKIEKGDLKCELGLVFEVAALTGIVLFQPETAQLGVASEAINNKLVLLPQSIRTKKRATYDDF